ncbi:MAG TPA: aminotransferase class IV [Terriglobia bacterium]
MDPLILHNGRILPLAQARLSPGQSGLLAGWGVFTTLRLYHGRPFEFHRHWQRMARDAARLGVELVYGEEAVRDQIVELASANQRFEGAGRVSFVRNGGGLWSDGVNQPPTDLLVFTRELVAWPQSHRLVLQENAVLSTAVLAGVKMLAWAPNTLLLERARSEGFDDALLLNEKGELVECTSANVFLVYGGRVLTPPLSSGCLRGVTRDVLFEIAPRADVEIREQILTSSDLSGADEVFISSSTREVVGVGYVSPGWTYAVPGEITQTLENAFQRYVRAALAGL